MIKQLIVHNFKCIKSATIEFNDKRNIIVGNNGVGKSTLIEALLLAMGYGLNKLEITPFLFHRDCITEFRDNKVCPEITIEVVFDGEMDEFSGTNNTLYENLRGLKLRIGFNNVYSELFEKEKASCTQIPCEYYEVERHWFSDLPVKQQSMPFNAILVNSSSAFFNTSPNHYMANVLINHIGTEDKVLLHTSLRQLREEFDANDKIEQLNSKLSNEYKRLKISIDIARDDVFRNVLCPLLDDIPIKQIGDGDLCILKTILSIDKYNLMDKPKVVIVEEPETHLSHTKMYELIRAIEENMEGAKAQLIITTHNNFIANKLDLSNLIMIENNEGNVNPIKISVENEDLLNFFTKMSNYPTLRLILCKSAILVEGPTDEIIVTYYYKSKYGRHPFDDGIELITIGGTAFRRFAELAKKINKKIAIITDNDGLNRNELQGKRGLRDLPDTIRIFTEGNCSLKTLENSFVSKNIDRLQELSNTLRKNKIEPDTKEALIEFMQRDKTEWAYRLLSGENPILFDVPDYISGAVNWLLGGDE